VGRNRQCSSRAWRYATGMKVGALCLAGVLAIVSSSVAAADPPPRDLDELRAEVAAITALTVSVRDPETHDDLFYSVPCRVGRAGAVERIVPDLPGVRDGLERCRDRLRGDIATLRTASAASSSRATRAGHRADRR